MRVVRVAALTVGLAGCLATTITAPAFAGGKAAAGCADGSWTLAMYVTDPVPAGAPDGTIVGDLLPVGGTTYEPRNHAMLLAGVPLTSQQAVAIFEGVDNNSDGLICYKLPNGWTTTPPANKAGLLSLTDDKVAA